MDHTDHGAASDCDHKETYAMGKHEIGKTRLNVATEGRTSGKPLGSKIPEPYLGPRNNIILQKDKNPSDPVV